MTRRYFAGAAAAALTALAVAGCGSGGGGSSAPAAASGSAPSVSASSSSLGKIVVDGSGRTLYLFGKDTGKQSSCSGACASYWPPFTASHKPAAGNGVSNGALSLVKRSDGTSQVALDGHPLYYFSGDQSAGQLNGQGQNAFGAKWWAVAPSGSEVTSAAGSQSQSSSGGHGYSY